MLFPDITSVCPWTVGRSVTFLGVFTGRTCGVRQSDDEVSASQMTSRVRGRRDNRVIKWSVYHLSRSRGAIACDKKDKHNDTPVARRAFW